MSEMSDFDKLFDSFDDEDRYIYPLWMEEDKEAFQASKILWNPWLFKVLKIAKGMPWIVDVSMPCHTSHVYKFDNPENYFAISGDGLLSLLSEVITFEGDGRIRYVNLYEEKPESISKSSDWKSGSFYPSIIGRMIHERGVRHNDEMTFPELIEHLEGCVEVRKNKYNYA